MTPLDYADRLLDRLGIDAEAGGGRPALDALARRSALHTVWSSHWTVPDGASEKAFHHLLAPFLTERADHILAYLYGSLPFAELTDGFIRYALASQPDAPFERASFLAEGKVVSGAMLPGVKTTFSDCLKGERPLRIMAFGGGDCGFEKELGAALLDEGKVRGLSISCYDPYGVPAAEVNAVDATELGSRDRSAPVDVVTARWVLHHVAPDLRWRNLETCLAVLDQGGHFVAIEEGDFSPRDTLRVEHRLYRVLLMAMDVVINVTLRPAWVSPNHGFHLNYLDEGDLADIDALFGDGRARRTVHPLKAGDRRGQTVIVWHVGH